MAKFKIEWHEWMFLLLIGLFGFLAYTKSWLIFLNGLNPIVGFLVYYAIWFVVIFALSLTGFVILGTKIKNPVQIIGTLLIIFAINVLLNWTNGYVTYAVSGSFEGGQDIFYGSEDGALWYLFYNVTKQPKKPVIKNIISHIEQKPNYLFYGFILLNLLLVIIIAIISDYKRRKGDITRLRRNMVVLTALILTIIFDILLYILVFTQGIYLALYLIMLYILMLIFLVGVFVFEAFRRK